MKVSKIEAAMFSRFNDSFSFFFFFFFFFCFVNMNIWKERVSERIRMGTADDADLT